MGAGGEAINKGISGDQIEPHKMKKETSDEEAEFILSSIIKLIKPVRNRLVLLKWQVVVEKTVQREPTLPVETSNTKQQHAVGGGTDSSAENAGEEGDQIEKCD